MGKKLIIIGGGILAFFFIKGMLSYHAGGWTLFILFLVICYICNILIKRQNRIENQQLSDYLRGKGNNSSSIPPPSAGSFSHVKSEHMKYLLIGAAILIVIFWHPLATLSVYVFKMGDLLSPSNSMHPVIIWAVLGLFLGMVYGGFIAYLKFRLEVKYILMPLGLLAAVVILLLINHSYFKSTYQPDYGYRSGSDTTITKTVYSAHPLKRSGRPRHNGRQTAAVLKDTLSADSTFSAVSDVRNHRADSSSADTTGTVIQ